MDDTVPLGIQPDLSKNEVFEEVFRNYFQILKGYAWKYVLEENIAEDVVQEVFTHLWEKRKTIKLKISLKSYLYTSVYNRCINHIKHEKTNLNIKKSLSEEEKLRKLYYENVNQEEDYKGNEFYISKIKETIKKMPDQQQRVFVLSRKFSLKNKEIAEFLGISIKAVEKHVTKGLQFIREQLENAKSILFF